MGGWGNESFSDYTLLYEEILYYSALHTSAAVARIKRSSCESALSLELFNFQAEFHPRRDDVFFVGSMAYPRQMDVYDISGNHFPIRGEDLTSVCSVVKPHPTVNVVVGGNSSGRVFAFM